MSAASQRELVALSQWVNNSYADGTPAEVVDWRRISKVAEEAGEVVRALAGSVGENPRKGFTHTRGDVLDELLDTAVAALAAVEHLCHHDGQALALLDAHIGGVAARAGIL